MHRYLQYSSSTGSNRGKTLRILLHYCFLFLLIIPTVISYLHQPSSQSSTMCVPTDTDTTATVDAVVEIVSSKAKEWAELPIERKIKLLEQLLENAKEHKDEWVSCQEKKLGIDPKNPLHGYGHSDVTSKGPATFGGYANGILTSLKHSKKHGTPPQPTSTRRVGDKTIATVWPSRFSVLESLEAFGMTAEMVCHGDEPLQQTQEEAIQEHYRNNRCAAILGPGNFDAPTDVLCELFTKGRVCVYKPNPINEASVDVLKKILEPVNSSGKSPRPTRSSPRNRLDRVSSDPRQDQVGKYTGRTKTQQTEKYSNQSNSCLCRIGRCDSMDHCPWSSMDETKC
jgi:hypothetical protein